MTSEELGQELRRMYEAAPRQEKGARMVLFGIAYAHDLKRCCREVVRKSGVPMHQARNVALGVQLEPYVTVDRIE